MFGKDFYPTPKPLINKMISKIKGDPDKILEPHAGKADIIDAMTDVYGHTGWRGRKYPLDSFSAIEINEDLQAMLRGKGIRVIDTDFLSYSGPDKFDLIIANPPFDNGDLHLLKAINIMYRGEIIFLLNAETIKNPYTNTRKELVKRLKELNAEVEYIRDAFLHGERPTDVEVALVYINIERNVEDDLFTGMHDRADTLNPEIENNYEVSTRKHIEELVLEYNQVIKIGTDTIIGYYRNFRKIGKYLMLNKEPDKYCSSKDDDLTSTMQAQLNNMLVAVRTDFWRRTLDLREIRHRLTSRKQSEFEDQLSRYCYMDFTENNIRQFVLNLIGGYEKTLTDAVLEVFDKFTIRHCWSDGLYDENIHYFNGWKTNKAFKVGKKVIIPIYAGYGNDGPFRSYGKWRLDYGAKEILRDIDTVMNYFDGMSNYLSMNNAIEEAFARGQSANIKSRYFTINCYKKGTIHLTFNDEGVLRRFNVVACKGKNWLPHEYGTKSYSDFTSEEKDIVHSFEGEASYTQNLDRPLFPSHNLLSIAA